MGRPAGWFGLAGFPFGKWDKVPVFISWRAGGWVETGSVRLPGPHCPGHFVVDFEGDAFGAVAATLLLGPFVSLSGSGQAVLLMITLYHPGNAGS